MIAKEPLIHADMTPAKSVSFEPQPWDSDDRFSGRTRRELFAEVLEKTNIIFYFDLSNGKIAWLPRVQRSGSVTLHDPTFLALLDRTKFCGNPV